MSIDRALTIEGWMEPQELAWLHDAARGKKLVVEVGSYLGRSTRALVDGGAELVIAIDDWYGERQEPMTDEWRAGLEDKFKANLADAIAMGQLEAWKLDHGDLSAITAKLAGRRPDMVFIDGDHLYDTFRQDLVFWSSFIAPGGLLSGHDYFHDGVQKAVTERLAERHAVIGSIWYGIC